MGDPDKAAKIEDVVKEKEKEETKEEKKKEGKEETAILAEPAKPGDKSIFVDKKIGMPGDKIMVDGEMNEVADDAKDAKDPVVAPPAKKGVEIKLFFPLAAEHAEGKPVK